MNPPNVDIWDEPEMHRALAARDISTVYRLLCDAGLSQTQIGKLTGQSQSEVSEILNGRRVLSYAVLARIADGLGIPRGHMGLAYADAAGRPTTYSEDETGVDAEVDDDMISRRFLGMASTALLGSAAVGGPITQLGTAVLGEEGGLRLLSGPAGRLGKSDIAWIKDMTVKVWELDLQHGGGAAYGLARGVAEQVVGAVRTSPPNREVQLAASRLCWTAAWSAFDAGHRRMFWRCHATALDLAKQAGDADTMTAIVSAAGRAEILSGNHRAAAKLFELVSLRKAPDAVAWGLLGSAYAPNSPESAKSALIRLRNAEGANSLDAQAMNGHVSLDIGDYATAVSAFDKVVPQRTGRLAVQETAPLAIAHLKANETRVGVQHAERAFALSQQVRSAQCTDALQRLSSTLAAQMDSTAQDLARQISASTAA
ncbi:MAG: helix-turn-helix domain-containing protein [Pseudonocardiaceae bacterium]